MMWWQRLRGLRSSDHPQYLSPCQANNASFRHSRKCFPRQSHRPGFPALLFEYRKGWQLLLLAGISLGLTRNCFSQSCQEILAKASATWHPRKAQGKGRAAAKVFRQTVPGPHSAGGAGWLRTSVRGQAPTRRNTARDRGDLWPGLLHLHAALSPGWVWLAAMALVSSAPACFIWHSWWQHPEGGIRK